MSDKPLHVRVAEKIGWTQLHARGDHMCPSRRTGHDARCGDITLAGIRYAGRKPGGMIVGYDGCHDDVPEFDADWAAIGPEITRLGLTLARYGSTEWQWGASYAERDWGEPSGVRFSMERFAETPLEAVCALILALPDGVVKR